MPAAKSRTRRRRRWTGAAAVVATSAVLAGCNVPGPPGGTTTTRATTPPTAPPGGLQEVMFVGNNWDGTADVIRSAGDFAKIGRINVIPDRAQRMAEINLNILQLIVFNTIRETAGEGHDQFVDDLYSTPDGTALVASRPSFSDVVSIDVRTGGVNWRFPVPGYRSDHMAVSADGRRVAVSGSLSNKVFVLDIFTGRQLGAFATGDRPHENYFSKDGKIWNASIGNVFSNTDAPGQDGTKGNRIITVADASTYRVVKSIDMRQRLNAAGRSDLSDAVRPYAFTPDESKLYFQVSFFGGIVEYDVASDRITRVQQLPASPATNPDRTSWVNDSRHHGLAMKPTGDKLCVAGTVDEYATIVDRATLQAGPLVAAGKPYWATVSGDGRACVISESANDRATAIDFNTGQKVASVAVGDHPQRIRVAHVPTGWRGPTG
jgi:hypothetical protein